MEEGGVTTAFQRFPAYPLTGEVHRKRLEYGLFTRFTGNATIFSHIS
jgi:hypothetical protein